MQTSALCMYSEGYTKLSLYKLICIVCSKGDKGEELEAAKPKAVTASVNLLLFA